MVLIGGKKRRTREAVRGARYTIYTLNFILMLHTVVASYFFSNFLLARGLPEGYIGVVYATGAFMMLTALFCASYLFKRFGAYASVLVASIVELFIFLGLAFSTNLILLIPLFLMTFAVPGLIAFALDMLLENSTRNEELTSGIRGIFITMGNSAIMLAPLIGGYFVADDNYSLLLVVSALIFLPFIVIVAVRFKTFRDPAYVSFNARRFLKMLTGNRDLRNIFIAQFLLRCFYGTMVIYTPLYLHNELGIPLQHVGVIIAIALAAYVFLEIPLGKLEDARWGEQEILIIGFAALAFTTASLAFITSTSLSVWAVAMFITRIGAAMIEVSSEGYFFKHVDGDDTDDVSAFRMLYPLAFIVSPLFGSFVLWFFPFNVLFLAVGAVMLLGIPAAIFIRDTK
jgi:MFS family permease